MSANLTTNLWYQYFMGYPDRNLILIGVFGIRALWASLGIVFNFAVVYITFKNKNLHGVCNILIALESFFAIFQDANYFVSFGVVVSGVQFITYDSCFPMLFPLAVCGDAAQMTMVFTGIDRLIAVVFPVWYKMRKGKLYLIFVFVLIGCYMCYAATLYILDYTLTLGTNSMVSCASYELGQTQSYGAIMNIDGITLSITLMCTYTVVYFTVFVLKETSKALNENNKRLIKSLIFLIGFNLIGVCFKSGMRLLFAYIQVNKFVTTSFNVLFAFMTIAVYSANAPVLFIMSNEYRSKFHKHFSFIQRITFNKFPSQSQIVPLAQTGFIKSANSSSHQSNMQRRENNWI